METIQRNGNNNGSKRTELSGVQQVTKRKEGHQ